MYMSLGMEYMRHFMESSDANMLFFHFSKQLFGYVYIPQI